MKRFLLTICVVAGSGWIGHAQEPSSRPATLGVPRASLGLPRPASDTGSFVVPTQHTETAAPAFISPAISRQPVSSTSPYSFIDVPKKMPDKAAIADDNTTDPKTAPPNPPVVSPNPPVVSAPIAQGPVMSAPFACADEPLFALPANAPPFIYPERWKFTHEYLMWWGNGYATPPLLTTGPVTSDGIIGQPGVSVLYGNQAIGNNLYNGYRFGFTYWCGPCWGLDGRFFTLGATGKKTSFSSDTISELARPFYDTSLGGNNSELIASTGTLTGGVIFTTSSYVWGADINARRKLYQGCVLNIDGLIGYRFMNLTESLDITESSVRTNPTSVAPFVTANGTVQGASAFDRFRTSNRFNGGQFGLAMECNKGRWTFDLRTTVAIGVTQASVDIDGGQTVYYTNGNSVTSRGGLYALDSNIGHHTSSHFAVMPEATFNIGYNITPRCRIFVGYNVIYWSSVLRPGNQIDTAIDSTRIPNFGNTNPTVTTSTHPTWTANYSGYFLQGVNFGLTFRW